MPSPLDVPYALTGAYLRVRRAREHLSYIKGRISELFLATEDDAEVVLKTDPDSGKLLIEPPARPLVIPAILGVIVGETIYNLRAALDYMIFDLAYLDSRSMQEMTQFPIENGEDGWRRHKPTYLKGLSVEHIASVERLQPYDGRDQNMWLRRLRDISNADKHCQWTVVEEEITANIFMRHGPPGSFANVSTGKVESTVAPDGRPVDVHMYGKVTGVITLNDGTPIIETLEQLIARVGDTLDAFKSAFE